MERYESYKDSGVKWLGEIPGHWEISCLRRFLRNYSVKGHADKPLLSVTREKGVILRGAKGDDGNNNIIPEDLSGYKHVKKGQFVINKMKSWQGSYGVSKYEGIVSPAYFVYDLDFEDKRFFSWAIRSKNYIPFFMQYSKGIRVDQWDLTPENVKCIPFFIPPKSEQTAIANYLDSVTSKIDEAISQQQKMIDLLNERKQIIIQNAVTKGLDPNAKMKNSGVEWLGEIPGHWEVRRLKFVTKYIFLGKTPKYSLIENKYKIIGQKCNQLDGIKMSDCKYAEENFYHERKEYEFLLHGDVLLNSLGGGSVGRIGYYNLKEHGVLTDGHIIVIRNKPDYNSRFLYYFLSTKRKDFETMASGSTNQMFLLVSDIIKQFVPLPPKSEQIAIANYLDSVISKIDEAISQQQKMISLLQERKQIIINDVVTGKVKVV